MTTDTTHELIAAYALGSLEPHERTEFERHLAGCGRCREEMPPLRDAAAALAFAVERAEPPDRLRERILTEARAGGKVLPFRRGALRALAAAAAIAAVAAIGLGIWAASLNGSLDRERSARAAQDAALAVLSDPGARRVRLIGRSGILAVRNDGTAALAVAGLARTNSGRAYQAWVIRGGTPLSAGVFRARTQTTLLALSRGVTKGATVAVTLEPAGGSPSPTGSPILRARA